VKKQNAELLWTILGVIILIAVFLCIGMLTSSCCKNCPPPPIGPPVVVEKVCELPPVPVLPVAKTVAACAPALFCYDAIGAIAVVERDGKLRQWVAEGVARCGKKTPPDAGPAPRPSETGDARSSDSAR
jgi:hypothetical protein